MSVGRIEIPVEDEIAVDIAALSGRFSVSSLLQLSQSDRPGIVAIQSHARVIDDADLSVAIESSAFDGTLTRLALSVARIINHIIRTRSTVLTNERNFNVTRMIAPSVG